MDYIHIDNLSFNGKHGVYAQERKLEQEFALSIKLGVDIGKAAESDAIEDTVNYSDVKAIAEQIITGKSSYLIEKLAVEIAEAILQDKRVHSAEVTIKKVAVWKNGIPGVTVFRERE